MFHVEQCLLLRFSSSTHPIRLANPPPLFHVEHHDTDPPGAPAASHGPWSGRVPAHRRADLRSAQAPFLRTGNPTGLVFHVEHQVSPADSLATPPNPGAPQPAKQGPVNTLNDRDRHSRASATGPPVFHVEHTASRRIRASPRGLPGQIETRVQTGPLPSPTRQDVSPSAGHGVSDAFPAPPRGSVPRGTTPHRAGQPLFHVEHIRQAQPQAPFRRGPTFPRLLEPYFRGRCRCSPQVLIPHQGTGTSTVPRGTSRRHSTPSRPACSVHHARRSRAPPIGPAPEAVSDVPRGTSVDCLGMSYNRHVPGESPALFHVEHQPYTPSLTEFTPDCPPGQDSPVHKPPPTRACPCSTWNIAPSFQSCLPSHAHTFHVEHPAADAVYIRPTRPTGPSSTWNIVHPSTTGCSAA